MRSPIEQLMGINSYCRRVAENDTHSKANKHSLRTFALKTDNFNFIAPFWAVIYETMALVIRAASMTGFLVVEQHLNTLTRDAKLQEIESNPRTWNALEWIELKLRSGSVEQELLVSAFSIHFIWM